MITVAVTAFQTDKVFVGVLIFALSGICVKKLVLAGAPIVVVGAVFDTPPFQLIAQPEFASIPALRGTTRGAPVMV